MVGISFDHLLVMYKFADPMLYGMLKEYARENRKHQTDAERHLWNYLKDNALGVKFLRQHIIAEYIGDFVCTECRLVVEVDGGYHAERNQQYNDEIRTEVLNSMGFRVIRFTNEQVFFDLENTLNRIKQNL